MVGGSFLGTNTIYWSTMVSTLNLIPPNPRLTKGNPTAVYLVLWNIVSLLLEIPVADPWFPRGGATLILEQKHIIWQDFCRKLLEIEPNNRLVHPLWEIMDPPLPDRMSCISQTGGGSGSIAWTMRLRLGFWSGYVIKHVMRCGPMLPVLRTNPESRFPFWHLVCSTITSISIDQ